MATRTYELSVGDVTVETQRTAPTYAVAAAIRWTFIPPKLSRYPFGEAVYVPRLAFYRWIMPVTLGGILRNFRIDHGEIHVQLEYLRRPLLGETSLAILPVPGLVGELWWVVDTP